MARIYFLRNIPVVTADEETDPSENENYFGCWQLTGEQSPLMSLSGAYQRGLGHLIPKWQGEGIPQTDWTSTPATEHDSQAALSRYPLLTQQYLN